MCGCALVAYLGLWQLSGDYPRTVTFDLEYWENSTWGLHSIERHHVKGTVSVSADGSRANTINRAYFKHYFVPSGDTAIHTIYVRPTNVAYSIDDKTRTTEVIRCACNWGEAAMLASDASCSAAAKAVLGSKAMLVAFEVVAGISAVRYRTTGSKDEHEAAFAATFYCDMLEEKRATYNSIGIPTSRSHFIMRSYAPGEPRRESFRPPSGYAAR